MPMSLNGSNEPADITKMYVLATVFRFQNRNCCFKPLPKLLLVVQFTV
ncbi:hypothetical protein J2754_002685 [Halarchaeum solikamskense]|nr:hypothetical protein [Halarchaeum solikamskense]